MEIFVEIITVEPQEAVLSANPQVSVLIDTETAVV
jgi:hypothetical protein